MAVVRIDPTNDYPLPYDMEDDEVDTFADELAVAANTAELLEELGAPIEVDPATLEEEKKLLDAAIRDKKTKPLTNLPTAAGAAAFLREYGKGMAMDANQVRLALTNKLLEIADCGETKYELKAIELLGKHSDIGLFTERSEINVNYNSPEGLEAAIKERVKRLLNADVIDIKPLGMDLDEELGILDADFSEVVFGDESEGEE
jgi:hypothetical protein